MKELIITTAGVNYATGITAGTHTTDSLGDLSEGALCAFTDGGLSISTNPSAEMTSSVSSIRFALGRTSDIAQLTQFIDRATARYTSQIYVAPVAKKMILGHDNASSVGTIVAKGSGSGNDYATGDPIAIRVVDLEKAVDDTSRQKYYEVPYATSIDASLAALVAKINADSNRIVTASVSGTTTAIGVLLTAKTTGHNFTARPEGAIELFTVQEPYSSSQVIINGTITSAASTQTTLNVEGYNSVAMLQALEKDSSIQYGNVNSDYLGADLYKEPSRVVSGQSYKVYLIQWETSNTDPLGIKHNPDTQSLYIAIPIADVNTTIAALDLILAAL